VTELSLPRFFAVLGLDLLFIWLISEVGGWAGFALLFGGVLVLGVCAFRWGADSRDGRNWTNGRGVTVGTNKPIDEEFVEDQISRLERQFRPND